MDVKSISLKKEDYREVGDYLIGVTEAKMLDNAHVYGIVYAQKGYAKKDSSEKFRKQKLLFTVPNVWITQSSLVALVKSLRKEVFVKSEFKEILVDDGVLKEALEPMYKEYMDVRNLVQKHLNSE